MESPRETSLYRQIAKDFQPKRAEMQICRYIEKLEERIAALEAEIADLTKPAEPTEPAAEPTPKKRAPKTKTEAEPAPASATETVVEPE